MSNSSPAKSRESLTSGQRKLIYLGGIVLLLVAAIILGAPSTSNEEGGGKLARLRVEYELGESTLGKVDPSSATMNLVLLGLRGIAANVLWMEHEELKKTKNWARMDDVVNSIITLQPHFLQVWRYHGWDLAYNVSAQWDDVRDRYFWVKKGAKFTMRGVEKNAKFAELPWDVGRLVGHKIGRSDEWRYFRKFFLKDPDPDFEGSYDPNFNITGKDDNYDAAYEWFTDANEVEAIRQEETGKGQHQMMRELFRHYPARSYFDKADALHREGTFGDVSKRAWEQANFEWENEYGKERFIEDYFQLGVYWLNADKDDIPVMLREDASQGFQVSQAQKLDLIRRRQDVTNFRYWQSRSKLEAKDKMVDAHRLMYDGRQLWKRGIADWSADGTPPESVQKLQQGMQLLEDALEEFETSSEEYDDQSITQDVNLIEEAMLAVYFYRAAHEVHGYPIPEDYPLKGIWEANLSLVPEIKREFDRDLGGFKQ